MPLRFVGAGRVRFRAVSWTFVALFATGCGGDSAVAPDGGKEITCGAGTVLSDGGCVPAVSACGAGTVRQGDTCVPSCADGEYWGGSACLGVPSCAAGTTFDSASGTCIPACPGGQAWNGSACASAPACGPGTAFSADAGACVPVEVVCGDGTIASDGGCVPVLTCGAGTHVENGACVVDSLPEPDIVESPTDGAPAEFSLPAAGGEVVLGGLIDLPADKNADDVPDGDWDAFAFDAPAGTWLRISAASEGAALPAFLIDSDETDAEGNTVFRRIGLCASSNPCAREVYISKAGRHTIWLSDYRLMTAALFGQPVVPVGGPDFSYVVTIENLGTPVPVPITPPYEATHNLEDGKLAFFTVEGVPDGQLLEILARPVKPAGAAEASVFPALVSRGSPGQDAREYVSTRAWESAAILEKARSGGVGMVVRDFLAILGPEPQISFAARVIQPTDCHTANCSSITVTDAQDALLSWPMNAGDFFVEGTYFDQLGETLVHHALLDASLNPLSEPSFAYPGQMASAWGYADTATTFYLWLRWGDGGPTSTWQVDARVHKTGTIAPGSKLTAQPIFEMPPYTLYPAGIQHFSGQGGKVVFLTPRSTTGAGWVQPFDMIWDKKLEQVGPVMDVNAWNFPEGFATPLFTYIKDNGHNLYYIYDQAGDPTGGTYDIQMSAFAAAPLGRPAVSAPITKDLQSPNGRNFYTFEAARNQPVDITISPVLASDILPEVWVMNFGKAEFGWIMYEWNASPDAAQLGLVLSETAPAAFAPFSTRYISPYDGLSVMLVMDAGGNAGPLDMFKIQLAVPAPPANDKCQSAQTLALTGGTAQVAASTQTAIDDVSSLLCVGYYTYGPDTFYKIDLAAGDKIKVSIDSDEFLAAVYLLSACGDPEASCVAGAGGTGNPAGLEVTVATGGTYYIGVDGIKTGGEFTLDVTVNGQ